MNSPILDFPFQTPPARDSGERQLRLAFEDIQRGHPVILLDDFDRENEGDLIVAAERVTPEVMALLIRECSGIVCLCLDETIADHLELSPMVSNNESRYQTAFTVSIEARHGVTTGVSAHDRVETVRAAIAETAKPSDLVHPGHVFPLRAKRGGVLERRGHTEGAVDLAVLAGQRPAALLCELTNADGTMSKGIEIVRFAEKHGMRMLSVDELVRYRTGKQMSR
jgi:3,4-dihydroxy 2-butanone 4-phosphate synthase